MNIESNSTESSPLTRRKFLVNTGVSALSLAVIQQTHVLGAEAGAKIDIGLIGCGGRGQWIAELFRKHGGYNLADLVGGGLASEQQREQRRGEAEGAARRRQRRHGL